MWAPSVKPIKVVSSSEGELQLILIVDQQHQLVQDIATEENWVDQKDDKWCNHCGLFQRINSIRMEHCEHLFVGRMCHLERSPSHCVVVQVQGCVCVYVAMLNIKRWTNVTLLISNHFYLILLTQHLQTGNARLLRFFDWAPFLLAGQDSWPVSRWQSSERASASKIPMGRYPNVGWVGHVLKLQFPPKNIQFGIFVVNELVIVPAGYLESYSNFEIHIVW